MNCKHWPNSDDEMIEVRTTTYSCPSVSTNSSGSGSTLKCWHYKKNPDTTTYSCPSTSTNHSGSGTSLSCWHYTYSCPSTSNYSEGSGSNLKCYVVTGATFKYNCNVIFYYFIYIT